ncbi:MAG: glycosyltransferase, partial [bacterium]
MIRSIRPASGDRPRAEGKFLVAGGEKLLVKGVTYGAFRPDADGREYQDRVKIEADFRAMVEHGFNAVRIPHTTPPRSLLDAAERAGLRVMVGLSAEQYAGYLIDRHGAPDFEDEVRAKVRACAGHPAILCYAIGNEIPAPLVRWIGRRRVEQYLERMWSAVKREDPGGLVTYVNYPTTEYLQLPFLDLLSFNVYLENRETFEAYLARLQNLAGDRPLLMSELGLDSLRGGEDGQAASLDWQVRTALDSGCAGAFVFSWTDEWWRGGAQVDDWKFGLTDHERRAKPALESVRQAFAEAVNGNGTPWPRISVVVCTYNGSRAIRDACEGLQRLDYPDFEVIVVDDGSVDGTAAIVENYGYRVIRTENRGLSSARNTGLAASTGEIVAYLDDDAYPDRHWLAYLALSFLRSDHAGIGGPNVTPSGDGPIAECIANSPGNPTHVLLTDREAEHVPGCNMAFRRDALRAIGGFDARFRTAGDDVDVCWRIRERGWTIGFAPAAMVWHHRRNSIHAYLRQQLGYGKAEGMLQRKFPEKHNGFGHWRWHGTIYGSGTTRPLPFRSPRVYHGTWGSAPFQSMYDATPGLLLSLPLMPEWYVLVLVTLGLSLIGLAWPAMRIAWVGLALAAGALVAQAVTSAVRSSPAARRLPRIRRWKRIALTSALHLVQPIARLAGRFQADLLPPREWIAREARWPAAREMKVWTGAARPAEQRLAALEDALRGRGLLVARGGEF